jgi:hypothetical protein
MITELPTSFLLTMHVKSSPVDSHPLIWAILMLLWLAVAALGAAPADFTVRAPADGRTFKLSDARG